MEITRKIVKQPFAPDTTDVLWLDSSGDSDVLKSFCNGQWKETSTPQQDYIVIAPKDGRGFMEDAAALAELKKAVLNGIGFDCLLKNLVDDDGTLDRVLGFYEDCSDVYCFSTGNGGVEHIELPHTVAQYQGLAAVQEAIDKQYTFMTSFPHLAVFGKEDYIQEDTEGVFICVDNKYIIASYDTDGIMTSMVLAESGPAADFVNITWEDAQKLIGYKIG